MRDITLSATDELADQIIKDYRNAATGTDLIYKLQNFFCCTAAEFDECSNARKAAYEEMDRKRQYNLLYGYRRLSRR